MNTKLFRNLFRPASLLLLAGALNARAADGWWTTDADGNWTDINNWNFASGPIADESGSTAFFTNTISATRVVTSDAARTIGSLAFTGSGAFNWVLTNLSGTSLTLEVPSGMPTVTVNNNTATINATSPGLAGTQGLLKNGPGILALAWNNTYSGGTVIGEGRVNVNTVNSGQFGTGSVTITNNAILMLIRGDTTDSSTVSGSFTNALVIPAGQTGTLWNQARGTINGTLTGSGTLNLRVNATRGGLDGNWSGFAGQINVTSRSGVSEFRHGTYYGYANAKINLNSVSTTVTVNPPTGTGGSTFSIGELSGAATATIYGCGNSGIGGRYINWQIGALNTSSTFGGRITDSVCYSRLVKVGTGSLTLTNHSPFAGGIQVNAGKLVLATGGSVSNSPVTVAASATNGVLVLSAGGQTTETNVIFRPSSAMEFNFGTVTPSTTVAPLRVLGTLSATNTVAVNVLGGVWTPGAYPLVKYSGALGGNGFEALSLATVPLRVVGVLSNDTVNSQIVYVVSAVNQPLHWAAGNGDWDIATTANWQDAANTAGTYQEQLGVGDQVLFNDAASGASPITVTLGTSVTPANVTFSNATKAYALSGGGSIAGSVGLTKQGASLLTLATANTFTGPVNLNGGTVNFTTAANLGAGTALNFGGGTLQFGSGNTTDISARTVTLNAGGGTIDTVANDVTFSNRIGNSGVGGLTKTGAGTLTLETNSTYTGSTVISQGKLALGVSASLSNSPVVLVSAGATLDTSLPGGLTLNGLSGQTLAGGGHVIGAVTSVSGAKIAPGTNGVVGTLTLDNDLTLNGGTFYFDVGSSSRDLLVVSGYLYLNYTASGTMQINALNLLPLNSTNKLIRYPVGQLGSGSVSTLSVAISGVPQPGRLFQLDNSVDGEISLIVLAAPARNLTWAGDGSANAWDITSPNWTGVTNTYSEGDNAFFTDSGAVNSPVNISPSAVTPNSVTVNATLDYTFSGAKITGPTTLTKSNTGKLTLANSGNDYGATVLTAGVLQIGDGSAYGTAIGQGPVTDNATLIFNQPDNSVVPGDIAGTGTLTKESYGTLTLLGNNSYGATTNDTGTLQIGGGGAFGTLGTGPVTLLNGGSLVVNRSGTVSLANGITGNGQLTLAGPALVTFGGANDYLNNTTIADGTLKLAAPNVIPSGGLTTGWVLLDGGATAGLLDLNGYSQTVNALSGAAGTVLGQIVNNGSGLSVLTIGTPASTVYAGLILDNNNAGSGKVGLTVNGDGTLATSLTLSGANSYSGPVYIDGASVILGGSLTSVGQSAIGTGPITLTNSGSLAMNGLGNVGTATYFVNSVTVPAGTTGALKTSGRCVYSGNIVAHGTLNLTTSYVRSQPSGDWSASDGQINILAGSGGGDVYLATTSGFNFGTAAMDLGAGVHLYNSANNGGPINITIGELTGTGTISDTTAAGPTSRTTIFVVGGRNTDATFSGTIANQARWTGINKVGTGKWTLDGVNTYSAATTVTAGTLVVGASSFMANSTQLYVANGALLDLSAIVGLVLNTNQSFAGHGVVTGDVAMVASDLIYPGGSGVAGTLSFSNSLVLGGDVTNVFDLSNSPLGTNDQLVVQGDLSLNYTNSLLLNALSGSLTSGVYPLIKYHGALKDETGTAVPVGVMTRLQPIGTWATQSHATLIVSNAPGQIVLIVNTGAGSNLTWAGDGYATTWDLTVSTNWLQAATPVPFFQYDKVTFGDPTTNTAVTVTGTLVPASVTVNSATNYTLSGAGKLTGSMGVTKTGNGTLTIATTGGNDYSGVVSVTGGTLRLGNAAALGATNGNTVVNGGTLDINGAQPVTEQIVVQGAGVGGNGAIVNHGAALVNQGFTGNLTLAGDTSFGGSNRWDLYNGTLTGNNYNLTKVGTNYIALNTVGDLGVSNITVQSGYLTLIGNTTLGSLAGKLYLNPGGRLDLYSTSVTNTKPVVMNGATLSSSNATNTYGGPISLGATEFFTASAPLTLQGVLSGVGSLVKNGASVLTLTASNTYSGTTTLSNGVLALLGSGSLTHSPTLDIISGAALDVSALSGGGLTLSSAQTLKGRGTVRGSLTAPAGSTVSPGDSIGTLTVTNAVDLQGATLMELNRTNAQKADLLATKTVQLGGTLTVVNLGDSLVLNDTFTLFSGALSGSFTSLSLPALTAGLAWDTSALAVNGTLKVVSEVPPSIGSISVVGGDIQLIGVGGVPGATYSVLASTNVLLSPVSLWSVVGSGTYAADGACTNVMPMNPAQPELFYLIKTP